MNTCYNRQIKFIPIQKVLRWRIFNKNELLQDAVIRNVEIIGEATKKISDNLKSNFYS
ncbi:MAG: DUF86 domain-containing protein [Bacteroidales bacterium]|nr:DUF86 domain-containing protein [Bacteroidales bacterium]